MPQHPGTPHLPFFPAKCESDLGCARWMKWCQLLSPTGPAKECQTAEVTPSPVGDTGHRTLCSA